MPNFSENVRRGPEGGESGASQSQLLSSAKSKADGTLRAAACKASRSRDFLVPERRALGRPTPFRKARCFGAYFHN